MSASDCAKSADCPHVMFSRCPHCGVEMYAPAVWAFSHGEVRCACGCRPMPKVRPSRQPVGGDGDE